MFALIMNCCLFIMTIDSLLYTAHWPLRPHCSNNVVLGGAVEVGEDMEMGHEEEEACATHQDDHHNTREVLRSGPLEFSGGELE